MQQPEFRTVDANGIKIRVAVQGAGPLVLMVHGFPESWYSWRHQIGPIADTGFTAAAMDVRGYGGSDKPHEIEAYGIATMCADIAGVIGALGHDQAILIGHDWGAPQVWNTALFHPEKVRAVAGLSVPHTGRGPMPRIEIFKQLYKDRFFYQLYFQEPGVAEAELEADVRLSLRKFYYWASGDLMAQRPKFNKPADDNLLNGLPDPDPLPAWLSESDLDYYASQFEQSGFRGPLNRYRTAHLDFEQQAAVADRKIAQPAAFIAGKLDPVLAFLPGIDMVEVMRRQMEDLRTVELIDGAGHWVQQEAPDRVNAVLLDFLAQVR
jgi:pimeloyl-ACP methyl ester carboxylesterase